MRPDFLASAVEDIPSIEAVLVIAMPDCLLFGAWLEASSTWKEEDVASYFGDLFRANREGLKALGSWSAEMQVTIDSTGHWILLQELNTDFVCAAVFKREAALGMVRLYTQRLTARIADSLPRFETEKRPRGVRVLNFLSRYAPDPHTILLRVSLRTKLPLELLEQPEQLADEQVALVEKTACGILGIESMNL